MKIGAQSKCSLRLPVFPWCIVVSPYLLTVFTKSFRYTCAMNVVNCSGNNKTSLAQHVNQCDVFLYGTVCTCKMTKISSSSKPTVRGNTWTCWVPARTFSGRVFLCCTNPVVKQLVWQPLHSTGVCVYVFLCLLTKQR